MTGRRGLLGNWWCSGEAETDRQIAWENVGKWLRAISKNDRTSSSTSRSSLAGKNSPKKLSESWPDAVSPDAAILRGKHRRLRSWGPQFFTLRRADFSSSTSLSSTGREDQSHTMRPFFEIKPKTAYLRTAIRYIRHTRGGKPIT